MNADRDDFEGDPDLAVLDVALTERLAGEAPPDVWPRVHAAMRGTPARAPSRHGWLVAALLLLALGTTAVFLVTREGRDPRPAAVPQDECASPSGPRTLGELQQRLHAAKSADLRARGSFCAGTNTWVKWGRHEWDSFLRSGLSPAVDRDDLAAIVTAIDGAQLATTRDDVVWTHELVVVSGDLGSCLLLQFGGPSAPRVAWRSPEGAVLVDAPTFPFAQLREPLTEITATSIAKLGLVIGPTGFAGVPSASTSLRLLDVPATAAGELPRFPQLRQLDLQRAPQWHTTNVLRQLPGALQTIVLSPAWLAADGYAALGALPDLQELHLFGGDLMRIARGEPAVAAPGLDDAAVAALGGLTRLRKITLAGGSFGDDALLALTSPTLERLAILDCPRVRGHTLGALRGTKSLALRGGALAADCLDQVAAMPALRDVNVLAAGPQLQLAGLRAAPQLRNLFLDGRVARDELALLTACTGLESLDLRLDPPLRDADLALLHGLTQLRHLSLINAEVTPAGLDALKKALPRCAIGSDRW